MCKRSLFLFCALLSVGAVGPALADDSQPASQASASAQTPAASSPYKLKLLYTGEIWDNAHGGIQTGTLYMQNVDAQLRVNTDQAFGWTGGKIYLEGFYNNSRTIDNFVGTQDSPSPIDTYGYTMFHLYQAYYDQNLGKTDLLFGFWDPESEFADTNSQNLFLNRNFTWNSALDLSGPELNYAGNYPWTTLAFRVREQITEKWSVQAAVLDGMKGSVKYPGLNDLQFRKVLGLTGIGEVDYIPAARSKFMFGFWGYTGKQTQYNNFDENGDNIKVYGSEGGYIGGETRLYTQEGKRGLDGFINLGFADPRVNEFDRSLNTGLTYTGLFEARPNDKIGIGAAINGAGEPYRKDQAAQGNTATAYETNLELSYHAAVNSWLKVQPDVQYIIRPNVDPTLKNDFLFGVHFEIGRWFNL